MSKMEDSLEACDAGLAVYNKDVNPENVNLSPSHPDEDSFHTFGNARPYASSRSFGGRNSRHARVHSLPAYFANENLADAGTFGFPTARPLFTPSRVNSLPVLDTSLWCPSPAPWSGRFSNDRIGINMRGPSHSSDVLPSLMMVQNEVSLRLENTPPSTPSDDAMAAEEKKDSSEMASELCTGWDGASVDTLDPFRPDGKGETVEGAASLTTAEGYPDSCNVTVSEDKSDAAQGDDDDSDGAAAAADDDESPPKDVVLLRESFSSEELTQSSASAVDFSSMQEEILDESSRELLPPEHEAMGFEQSCHGGPGEVKLDSCSPLHSSPTTLRHDGAGFLNNLPNPPDSAKLNAVLGAEAEAPDTGQSATDDDDVEWASCKICWHHPWKFIFIPCGHGSCRRCYIRLYNKLCPFCRKPIREIVEVHLVCSLKA